MDKRLEQLRKGFDIAVERTLRDKAAKRRPVVLCAPPDGLPVLVDAESELQNFLASRIRS